MRSGKFHKARDAFKALNKSQPARALPLLIEANLGLANEMMAKGLVSEANQVLAYLRTIAPASYNIDPTPASKEGDLVCVPLIPRDSPLPVTKSDVFFTIYPGQKTVKVSAYQGEHREPEFNSLIGEFVIEGLDPDAPANPPIVIGFGLDFSGMLKVTATEKQTGLIKTVTLDTHNLAAPVDLETSRQRISDLLTVSGEEDDYDEEEEENFSADSAGFIETFTPQKSATASGELL